SHFCHGQGQGRSDAAALYRISGKVLDKRGHLSSHRGDTRSARKVKDSGDLLPLTSEETRWIEAAVKNMIRRVGEVAADPDADWLVITMADLPLLSKAAIVVEDQTTQPVQGGCS